MTSRKNENQMVTTGYQQKDWQQALSHAIDDPVQLLEQLELPYTEATILAAKKMATPFPLRVPRGFVSRMIKGRWNDPLLRQVLPLDAETHATSGFVNDPLHEYTYAPVPGLLHKYHGRVLWIITGGCAVHCRYCFRRHYPYADHVINRTRKATVLAYLQQHRDVDEVILSGGDPLLIKDDLLAEYVSNLEKIPHIKRLRLHTRLPIVLPERITDSLLKLFVQTRLQVICVVHCNHPQEIDTHVSKSIAALHAAGVVLFNQAVLLKGINDRPKTLIALSQTLFTQRIVPYYLHQLDAVAGSAHFALSPLHIKRLMRTLQARLPGYMVPKFVQEVPGHVSKTWLSS